MKIDETDFTSYNSEKNEDNQIFASKKGTDGHIIHIEDEESLFKEYNFTDKEQKSWYLFKEYIKSIFK